MSNTSSNPSQDFVTIHEDKNIVDEPEKLDNIGFLFDDNAAYYAQVCKSYKMTVLGVLLLIVGILGHAGNSLTVFTLWPTRTSSATSLTLIVLAFCDSGTALVWWVNLGIPTMCDYIRSGSCLTYISHIYPVTYMYIWPVGRWCHYTGTWIVLLVTIHRFIAVCYPLKSGKWTNVKQTKRQLAVIGLGMFVYVLPRFFHQYLEFTPDGTVRHNTAFGAHVFWFNTFYESIAYVVIIYFIPFPVMVYMTVRLIISLRKTREKRDQMTKTKREEKDLTTTLVTVVIVFMFCQIPNPIRRLLVAILPNSKRQCDSFYPYYRSLASFLLVFNSSINFGIYCFCGERFRKTLVKRLNALLGRQNTVAVGESTVATATSQPSTN